MTASAVIPAMVTVKETPVTVKAKSVEKTPRPVPNIPMQLPALVTSRKMGAGRYYLLNANPVEAWSRDKWWTGTQAGRDGRTYGRKPRTDHRIVTVCDFASSVSTRELRKAFAPLAACYA
ncbi:MAG: hypothetical protein KGJ13_03835 [Patescibacteria group bacterium]|nr:hypothetical protein [Patescibacteria group bacterium]